MLFANVRRQLLSFFVRPRPELGEGARGGGPALRPVPSIRPHYPARVPTGLHYRHRDTIPQGQILRSRREKKPPQTQPMSMRRREKDENVNRVPPTCDFLSPFAHSPLSRFRARL